MKTQVDKGTDVEQFICSECDQPYCTCSMEMRYCEICGEFFCLDCWDTTFTSDGFDETLSSQVCGGCWADYQKNKRINENDEQRLQ